MFTRLIAQEHRLGYERGYELASLRDSYLYFILIALSCMYACFQPIDEPIRYAWCVASGASSIQEGGWDEGLGEGRWIDYQR